MDPQFIGSMYSPTLPWSYLGAIYGDVRSLFCFPCKLDCRASWCI